MLNTGIRFLLIAVFCSMFTNKTFAQPLLAKQSFMNARWQLFAANQKKAVLGIDIGGTKIDWAVYPVDGGKLVSKRIAGGAIATPKGIEKFGEAYYNIVLDSIKKIGKKDYSLVGIGIGLPGRFVEYKKTDKVADLNLVEKVGDPFILERTIFLENEDIMIADGSADNLSNLPGEFDNVAIQSFFQRLSPKYVKVVIKNDAAVQMKGIINDIEPRNVNNKKIIYLGFGTGLGTAVMAKNGTIVTDGHFQYIGLDKIYDTQDDVDVFHIVRNKNSDKYNKFTNQEIITPEDLFSGHGVRDVLLDTFGTNDIPRRFDLVLEEKKHDPNFATAINRLKSIGKYLGNYLVKLYNGDFSNIDLNNQWHDKDKEYVKNFEVVILGGGMINESKFYSDFIMPEAYKVIKEHNILDEITFIKKDNYIATPYAAASLCDLSPSKEKPKVALTFDDGPHPKWTYQVLDLLKKYNAKATFFVIGANVEKHPQILKRIHDEGHKIGVHTFTHPNLTKLSDEKVKEELTKTIDAINVVLPGYAIKIMRPPYGAVDERVNKIIKSLGLKSILWDALGDDYLKIATPEYMIKKINHGLKIHKGGIVLLHDGGGDFANGVKLNSKFREGKQNVIDYLESELPIMSEKYNLIAL